MGLHLSIGSYYDAGLITNLEDRYNLADINKQLDK